MNKKVKLDWKSKKSKEQLSWNDKGMLSVDCADCGKTLMVFQLTDLNPTTETVILVHCGKCGGRSYKHTITGQFYPGAPDDKSHFEPLENVAGCDIDIVFRTW